MVQASQWAAKFRSHYSLECSRPQVPFLQIVVRRRTDQDWLLVYAMKLRGMAEAFRAQLETTDVSQLSFEERLPMLVDQQWLWKENRALARRLQLAKLKERGVIEDIDYQHSRGLDRKLMRTLSSSEWVRQNQNVLIGATLCKADGTIIRDHERIDTAASADARQTKLSRTGSVRP